MEVICPIMMIGGIIFVVSLIAKSGGGSYGSLVAKGVPARGILLMVSSTGTRIGTPMNRYDSRMVVIDVEIPGQPPYEVQTNVVMPANLVRDVLPGATVELRVNPKNRKKIAIVGPGSGFATTSLATVQRN